ncbi:hypothetical protein TSAR_004413 [Trichomalopsis sarcophagae]|uniref:Uncharacterized protein n=1 Tax=Trichomalopsis sarcophagae TaxID=543379 RepID=A0A232EMP0_9HYME|nr:hypothetical protein TSAR_004413 [Trichomalopsis sarcophagae]
MVSDSDLIGVTINSENFARGSAGISLRPVANFFVDDLWMIVSGVIQSNENFEVDDNFCIEATYVEVPLGTGKRKSFGINVLGQRSLISIVRNPVVVYDSNSFGYGEPPFFDGRATIRDVQPSKIINISYDARGHHYDTILNLTGAAKSKFYCVYCNKKYHYIDQHVCMSRLFCHACLNFLGITCFENHKTSGSYKKRNKKVCDLVKLCQTCLKRIHAYRGKHECPASENFDPILWLELVIHDIHTYLVSMVSDSDLIGVTINSENFARGSAGISLRPVANFFVDDLWMIVSGVIQSNENFEVDDNFCIEATYVEVPLGTGKRKSFGINVLGQRSLISIVRNRDNLCLPRSLVVGEAFLNLKEDATDAAKKVWTAIRDGRRLFELLVLKITRPKSHLGFV